MGETTTNSSSQVEVPNNNAAGVVVPSLTGVIGIKLDRTNYGCWLAQMLPMLKGKRLEGFVDGTNKCPPKFKLDKNGTATTEVDPKYEEWHQQDQMILGWINNLLTIPVLCTVVRFKSSRATWLSLEKRYASQSQNRIMYLRNELFNTKGEGLSVSDYIDKINQLADDLALAGKPVEDDDLVTIIMNNVGPTYENTVSSAQARDTPIGYDDLVALLLSAEMRIKAQNTPALEVNPTAMYPTKSQSSIARGRGPMNNRGSSFRGKGRGRGRGPPSPSSTMFGSPVNNFTRPVCQICDRPGHSALDCYQRMNQAYEGRVPTQKLAAMAATTSLNSSPTTWITDTGASNHITSDLANLTVHDDYRGKDKVAVGNGAGTQYGEDAFPRAE
ncbi:hypothetical protein ACHQM5_016467 [Ranunculus cassubicifolius]